MEISETRLYDPYLSKTLYTKGMQCHKALWLYKYRRELMDEYSASQLAVFNVGYQVGDLALGLFPGGVMVPYDGLTAEEQLQKTREALASGEETIYEATFSHDNIFVKVDILHRGPDGWELYEVKSATKLKEQYLHDIAVQYHVLSGSGLTISKACLVHINNQYVRRGDIEVEKLFAIQDLTETIRVMQPEIVANVTAMRKMLLEDMPSIDIGPHCHTPYACSFLGHCWSHIPENSVFEFKGHGSPDPFMLYEKGIQKMEDVPSEQLGWRQKLQLNGLLHRQNHIDVDAVGSFLDSLWYPLCFMDFETSYMVPVPLFDGIRPYQQVPFQYSLHVINQPNGEIQHFEFLADELKDPQLDFLEHLLAAIPPDSCILTWNKTFEEQRLRELAAAFPERSREILAIIENLRDLMVPFRDKSLYHWRFNGSYSIKYVLPAMVEGYSYEGMEINNGEAASAAWLQMIDTSDDEERERLRRNLLQYCHLDTYGMVMILKEMRKLVTS